MEENLTYIQDILISNMGRLDDEKNDIEQEVARSNAISQLANTYIKSCNLIIRVEESKSDLKNKIKNIKA